MSSAKRILVAPLDWGLGHATRCIPVIRELLQQGAQPYLATNSQAKTLLQKEFPDLPMLDLPPYDVRYPSRRMTWNIALQLPRIIRTLYAEHHLLGRYIRTYQLDGVISDNRFACFSRQAPCVFITHQVHLRIHPPWLQYLVRVVNYWFLRRFSICWIPDIAEAPGLSGELAHPGPASPARFVGCLSRLQARLPEGETYDVVFLLSGPEPQRTIFESRLLEQARHRPEKMLLVRGKPELSEQLTVSDRLQIVDFLASEALERVLANSRLVVCRSGYSTLMDLARLGKQAILVPTPGQTEQEYLAEQLQTAGRCYTEPQSTFDLSRALERARYFRGLGDMETGAAGLLSEAVREFLEGV